MMQNPLEIAVLEAYRLGRQSAQWSKDICTGVGEDGTGLLDPERIEDRRQQLVGAFGPLVTEAFVLGQQEL